MYSIPRDSQKANSRIQIKKLITENNKLEEYRDLKKSLVKRAYQSRRSLYIEDDKSIDGDGEKEDGDYADRSEELAEE